MAWAAGDNNSVSTSDGALRMDGTDASHGDHLQSPCTLLFRNPAIEQLYLDYSHAPVYPRIVQLAAGCFAFAVLLLTTADSASLATAQLVVLAVSIGLLLLVLVLVPLSVWPRCYALLLPWSGGGAMPPSLRSWVGELMPVPLVLMLVLVDRIVVPNKRIVFDNGNGAMAQVYFRTGVTYVPLLMINPCRMVTMVPTAVAVVLAQVATVAFAPRWNKYVAAGVGSMLIEAVAAVALCLSVELVRRREFVLRLGTVRRTQRMEMLVRALKQHASGVGMQLELRTTTTSAAPRFSRECAPLHANPLAGHPHVVGQRLKRRGWASIAAEGAEPEVALRRKEPHADDPSPEEARTLVQPDHSSIYSTITRCDSVVVALEVCADEPARSPGLPPRQLVFDPPLQSAEAEAPIRAGTVMSCTDQTEVAGLLLRSIEIAAKAARLDTYTRSQLTGLRCVVAIPLLVARQQVPAAATAMDDRGDDADYLPDNAAGEKITATEALLRTCAFIRCLHRAFVDDKNRLADAETVDSRAPPILRAGIDFGNVTTWQVTATSTCVSGAAAQTAMWLASRALGCGTVVSARTAELIHRDYTTTSLAQGTGGFLLGLPFSDAASRSNAVVAKFHRKLTHGGFVGDARTSFGANSEVESHHYEERLVTLTADDASFGLKYSGCSGWKFEDADVEQEFLLSEGNDLSRRLPAYTYLAAVIYAVVWFPVGTDVAEIPFGTWVCSAIAMLAAVWCMYYSHLNGSFGQRAMTVLFCSGFFGVFCALHAARALLRDAGNPNQVYMAYVNFSATLVAILWLPNSAPCWLPYVLFMVVIIPAEKLELGAAANVSDLSSNWKFLRWGPQLVVISLIPVSVRYCRRTLFATSVAAAAHLSRSCCQRDELRSDFSRLLPFTAVAALLASAELDVGAAIPTRRSAREIQQLTSLAAPCAVVLALRCTADADDDLCRLFWQQSRVFEMLSAVDHFVTSTADSVVVAFNLRPEGPAATSRLAEALATARVVAAAAGGVETSIAVGAVFGGLIEASPFRASRHEYVLTGPAVTEALRGFSPRSEQSPGSSN